MSPLSLCDNILDFIIAYQLRTIVTGYYQGDLVICKSCRLSYTLSNIFTLPKLVSYSLWHVISLNNSSIHYRCLQESIFLLNAILNCVWSEVIVV